MTIKEFIIDQKKWYSAPNNDVLYENRSEGNVLRNYAIQGSIVIASFISGSILRKMGIELSDFVEALRISPGIVLTADSISKNFNQGSLYSVFDKAYKKVVQSKDSQNN